MKRLLILLPFVFVACDRPMTAPAPTRSLDVIAAAVCAPTGFIRDGIDLTAAVIDAPTLTGTVNATGCDIGVYYHPGTSGSVNLATISGARYFGVVNDGAAVDVSNSTISAIGENPFNGTQHGVAIYYSTFHVQGGPASGSASGTISGNTITQYQKGGITVSGAGASASVLDNSVTGLGPVNFIAQNGIQISFGATAVVRGNSVSGNDYTPAGTTSCGILIFQADGAKVQQNTYRDNESNMCNFGKGGGNVSL